MFKGANYLIYINEKKNLIINLLIIKSFDIYSIERQYKLKNNQWQKYKFNVSLIISIYLYFILFIY